MQTTAKNLSDVPAINRFLSYCRVRTVPSKTVMIHAGDLPDVLYYIVDGSVEVMIEDEDGNEMVLAYLNKGQFFGEMGLFYEQPTRSAWVRTRTECEIAEMTYRVFARLRAKVLVSFLNLPRSSQLALTAPTASSVTWHSSMLPAVSLTRSWICVMSPTL